MTPEERKAFKERMKQLKAYREQNPGKGYWDFKAYQPGGETGEDDQLSKYTSEQQTLIKRGWTKPGKTITEESREKAKSKAKEIDRQIKLVTDTLKEAATDHPVEKPKIPAEPIKRVYTINQGKSDDSWRKYDKDGDGDLSPKERWERQKSERRAEDWKKLGSGINKTFGTAAALASIVAGGGWAATRLLNGNKASTLGQAFAKYVLPTNAVDTGFDAVNVMFNPTDISNYVDLASGVVLSRYRDFLKPLRQVGELGNAGVNAYNLVDNYAGGGETGDDDRTDHPIPQRIELEKQVALADYIDRINHTDRNGDYNPFYQASDDTYGTVELPTVQVTAPLTEQAQRNIEARRGAKYVHEGMEKGAKFVAPIVACAALPAIASTGGLGTALDIANIVSNPTDPLNYIDKFRLSRALHVNKAMVNTISKRFRNSEWSNFLSTENGDAYYRMARGWEGSNKNLDEKLFLSHTTPWEEFSGLGSSDPHGIKTLYKFPTNTFGVRKATNYKGVPGDIDVTTLGKQHLLYGNTSSGLRGPVQILPEHDAKLLDMDAYKIGVKDRPLSKIGLYDTHPIYEDVYLGNQTTVSRKELKDALQNTRYWQYDFDPNTGITKILHLGRYAEGGETGDDEPIRTGTTQYDAYGNTTYYLPVSLNNDTLNIGLPDIPITVRDNLNLAAAVQAGQDQLAGIGKEVFANLTPYGDIESAVYAYDAAKNRDWLGLSLAGLGMLPLIPGGIRKVKSATRPIPTVNKGLVESQLNRSFDQLSKDAALRAQVANEQYRVIERLMDDPAYMNRANQVAKQFGDNYVPTYADAMLMYDIGPEALPWVKLNDEVDAFGRMERLADGRYIYHRSKAISQPNTTEHELSHFMDMLKANSGNAEEGNKMFKEMNKDLKHEVDRHDRYFMDPSEQKAHMNQLREWMFQNNMLETRDQEVTVNELKKALKAVENVPGMEGVIRASKQFGDLKKYRKWFNTVPLVSVSPLMLNGTAREEEAV